MIDMIGTKLGGVNGLVGWRGGLNPYWGLGH